MRQLITKTEQPTIESLTAQIADLKAGRTMKSLKAEDKKAYYKVQGLTSKLSELKASESGKFITKAHLVEYKGLIIWLLKNKTNFKGYMNLSEAMQIILDKVENEKIVYKTERSIKRIVSELTIHAGLQNAEDNLRKANGLDYAAYNSLNNRLLDEFQTFRLNAIV